MEDCHNFRDANFVYQYFGLPTISIIGKIILPISGKSKFTEERTYRISRDIFEDYAEVYVLSYIEINKELAEKAVWEIDEAVAYKLISE